MADVAAVSDSEVDFAYGDLEEASDLARQLLSRRLGSVVMRQLEKRVSSLSRLD